ncbi:WAT1-related protein [Canna indica]|uniref:WAT1-related protein n=1 Tax=Canna indica TaxID=4628 RepID=A0AAQ3QGI3_9LILI|nr:WAT1-related protein [Canna indica]
MADGSFLAEHKPALSMVFTQFIYALMALSAKATFTQGLSPMVFVVYRQAIATVILAPISFIAKGRSRSENGMGVRGFGLVFLASLVGATTNQFLYYQGMALVSSSMATAMTNLIPAITFVMAASMGLEKLKIKSVRSMAKVVGTIICVGGAVTMAFFKGPKLLSAELHRLMLHSASDKWIMGSLFLIGSSSCWSFWLILQVPICKNYLDPLSLATWMCFLSTIQSAILTYLMQPSLNSWKIHSLIELFSCVFAGIFGSGVTFYLQSWCIAIRGPLYSALFNPLSTVITAILGFIILHERLYLGSMIGAVVAISGLYIVLWGKSKDLESKNKQLPVVDTSKVAIVVDAKNSFEEEDLKKPLIEESRNQDL